jgi:hypothetical protein
VEMIVNRLAKCHREVRGVACPELSPFLTRHTGPHVPRWPFGEEVVACGIQSRDLIFGVTLHTSTLAIGFFTAEESLPWTSPASGRLRTYSLSPLKHSHLHIAFLVS